MATRSTTIPQNWDAFRSRFKIVGTGACVWCASPIPLYPHCRDRKFCNVQRPCSRMDSRIVAERTGKYRTSNNAGDRRRRLTRAVRAIVENSIP